MIAGSPKDHFWAIRLFAAWLVLWSHSYPLTGFKYDPLKVLTGIGGGQLAVDVFFVLSGFMIAGSIERGTGLWRFVRARALRIFPALWVMLALTLMAYLVFASSHGIDLRILDLGRYFALNGCLLSTQLLYGLDGAFAANPYPDVINGSLWTLPWEVRMYALLAVLGFALPRYRGWSYAMLAVLAFAVWHLGHWWHVKGIFAHKDVWRFIWFFFAGATIAVVFRRSGRDLRWGMVAGFSGVVLAVFVPALQIAAYALALPLTIISLGYVGAAKAGAGVQRDLSYGTYLYAFPIQQSLVAVWPTLGAIQLTLAATPLTLLLALASWQWVERPALRLKDLGSPAPMKVGH